MNKNIVYGMSVRIIRKMLSIAIGIVVLIFFYKSFTPVNRNTIIVEPKKTETCRIPQIDPLHEEYRHLIQPREIIRCDDIISLTHKNGSYIYVNNTAILKLGLLKNFSHCVYNEIYRPRKGRDHNYFQHINFSISFKTSIEVNTESEFIRVICYNNRKEIIHKNFFAILQKKDNKTFKTITQGQKKPNVILLGIDAISRWNSMRYLPETRKILKDLGAIELTKYCTVGHNTFENMVPMLTGKSVVDLGWYNTKNRKSIDDFDFVWKTFKEEGYKTMFVEDIPGLGMFDCSRKGGLHDFPTDFFNRHLSVAIAREKIKQRHFCINNKFETNINLDYHLQFLNLFTEEAKFSFVFLNEFTHDYANRAASIDEILVEYVKTLKIGGHLENTFLFVFGDHGMRWGPIRESAIGDIEVKLPMMFILPPQTIGKKQLEILRKNFHRLTSPYDIHETLRTIVDKTSKKHVLGIDLLTHVPRGRNCRNAGIPQDCCPCQTRNEIMITPMLRQIVEVSCVSKINSILDEYSNKCAYLRLQNVSEAYSIMNTQYKDVSEFVFSTTPGNAKFQVQVRNTDNGFQIIGDITRINRYNNQSHCVQDYVVKLFCFCKDQLSE